LFRALQSIRERGIVGKIGVSIYHPDELDVLTQRYELDLIQTPFNIVDRRLVTSGWLTRLRDAGTEVHVRSIFLQGLLLMPSSHRPEVFDRWHMIWDSWQRWLTANEVTPLDACLGFALAEPAISRVVVGIDSVAQLREIIAATKSIAQLQSRLIPPETLMSNDLDLINPSRWPIQ
jgi:aryl-alcohol dehydrogenase-like predicted oxidoreductase